MMNEQTLSRPTVIIIRQTPRTLLQQMLDEERANEPGVAIDGLAGGTPGSDRFGAVRKLLLGLVL
jgi:hypothetical protein